MNSRGDFEDDSSHLPTNSSQYLDFLDQMNLMMSLAPEGHIKVALGLSMGAALAAGAALSTDKYGELIYSRAVCISPYFATKIGTFLDNISI